MTVRRSLAAATGVATLLTVLAQTVLAAAPADAVSRTPSWRCRTSQTSPSPALSATATVCVRFAGGAWRAHGSLRLGAVDQPVSGVVGLALERDPVVDVRQTFRNVTVRPGRPVVLPLSGSAAPLRRDRAVAWTVTVTVGTPGHPQVLPVDADGLATVLEGRMSSPWVDRRSAPVRRSSFRGQGANECGTGSFRAAGPARVTGPVGLCIRQDDGVVYVDVPHLGYTSTSGTPVSVTLFVDGRRATVGLGELDASPHGRTETALASTSAEVLHGQRRAVAEVEIDGVVVRSPMIRLRG